MMRSGVQDSSGRAPGSASILRFAGSIAAGRGTGSGHIAQNLGRIRELTGADVVPGTLNVVFADPILLDEARAMYFDKGYRMLWPVRLNGIQVFAYRWRGCPLHVMEVVADCKLREELDLADGSSVVIEIDVDRVEDVSRFAAAVWRAFWGKRPSWYYAGPLWYARTCKLACMMAGASQSGSRAVIGQDLKRTLKRAPVIGRFLNFVGAHKNRLNPYRFERVDEAGEGESTEIRNIRNLLLYTKTSNSSYSAREYPAGYQTIRINGETLKGQRDPQARISAVPYDFSGKTLLDVGCNQGGMTHVVGDSVRWGVGIDYDYRMVNVANRIRAVRGNDHLQFYVFDLEKDPLDLLRDLLPERKVDIVFLLSVCMWIRNWKEVLLFLANISDSMLFESNGTDRQQEEQEHELRRIYAEVHQVTEESADDAGQRDRRLFYCTRPRNSPD